MLNALKGIGFASFDWRAGARGSTHSLGKTVDSVKNAVAALAKALGKVDAHELEEKYNKNIKQKYP